MARPPIYGTLTPTNIRGMSWLDIGILKTGNKHNDAIRITVYRSLSVGVACGLETAYGAMSPCRTVLGGSFPTIKLVGATSVFSWSNRLDADILMFPALLNLHLVRDFPLDCPRGLFPTLLLPCIVVFVAR